MLHARRCLRPTGQLFKNVNIRGYPAAPLSESPLMKQVTVSTLPEPCDEVQKDDHMHLHTVNIVTVPFLSKIFGGKDKPLWYRLIAPVMVLTRHAGFVKYFLERSEKYVQENINESFRAADLDMRRQCALLGCNHIYNLQVKSRIVNNRFFITTMSGMAAYKQSTDDEGFEYEFDEEDMINRQRVNEKYGRTGTSDKTKEFRQALEDFRKI